MSLSEERRAVYDFSDEIITAFNTVASNNEQYTNIARRLQMKKKMHEFTSFDEENIALNTIVQADFIFDDTEKDFGAKAAKELYAECVEKIDQKAIIEADVVEDNYAPSLAKAMRPLA